MHSYDTREQGIRNRIEAMNRLHKFLNAIVPELMIDIKNNGFNIKRNPYVTLYKKDDERLKAYLKDLPSNVRAYFQVQDISQPSIMLKSDINYKTSSETCAYYSQYNYLGIERGFEPFPIIDIEEVLKDVEKLEGLKEQKQALDSEIYRIERLAFER